MDAGSFSTSESRPIAEAWIELKKARRAGSPFFFERGCVSARPGTATGSAAVERDDALPHLSGQRRYAGAAGFATWEGMA